LVTSIDWKNEWWTSLAWSGKAFFLTVAAGTVTIWLLVRFTRWGRQFWRLASPYFRPGPGPVRWRALLTVIVMVWMTVLAVRLDVLLSYWSNGLYTSLQELNSRAFGYLVAVFAILTAVYFIHSRVEYLIEQTFIIQWRSWLNHHMIEDWLAGRAYHRSRFVAAPVDNPDQRIQEDTGAFVADSLGLSLGAVRSVVALVSFTPILWRLSGPLSLFGHTVSRAMVFLAYLYVLVASVFAFRIGRPLIRLNFLNEGLAASFRYALIRLREHSEDIAFHQDEAVERTTLATRFADIIKNRWRIVFRSLKFDGFNIAVSQIALVVPYIIQAPRFFRQAITLGDVEQTTIAFGHVHGALSFFRNSYGAFAAYRAILNRLTGLLDANSQARTLPAVSLTECSEGVHVAGLTVRRPDGPLLIKDLTLRLNAGEAMLVTGPSGSGKTILLRSLAGLWPYARGSIQRPAPEHALFLSQQPYLPLGRLRTALTYPQAPQRVSDEEIRQALRMVTLDHLSHRIDDDLDWSRILSAGEQQRLGFARILINHPRLVFLDAATCALNEEREHQLYTLIRRHLPHCVLISVAARNTLAALHTHQLMLLGDGHWDLTMSIERDGVRGGQAALRALRA
jgi:putative ATP-binding cassette transporter